MPPSLSAPLDTGLLDTVPVEAWVAVSVGSLGMALASLVLMPVLIVRLPTDYVVAPAPTLLHRLAVASTGGVVLLLARNALGLVLLLLGLAMLVTPGQGLLTIVGGLVLTDLPGRHRLLVALLRRPAIGRAVARLRQRAGVPPIEGLGAGRGPPPSGAG